MPGGGREEGEDALQNIYRELSEELGIDKGRLTLVGISKSPIQYDFPAEMLDNGDPMAATYSGQKKDQVVFRYAEDAAKTLAMDTSELKSYMWCPVDELGQYLLFPGQAKEALRVLHEFDFS